MTYLSDLKKLAQAATPGPNGYSMGDIEALQAMQRQLSPERILAMIAVIKTLAEDSDEPCAYGDQCPDFIKRKHYRCRPCHTRAALAALERSE